MITVTADKLTPSKMMPVSVASLGLMLCMRVCSECEAIAVRRQTHERFSEEIVPNGHCFTCGASPAPFLILPMHVKGCFEQ
jgi:hypothetical protein